MVANPGRASDWRFDNLDPELLLLEAVLAGLADDTRNLALS